MTAVVRFPLAAPPHDRAPRGRLRPGQEPPEGVCWLHPRPTIARTPERAFLTALAGALPPKAYTALLTRLGHEARDGDPSALIALRIATGDL